MSIFTFIKQKVSILSVVNEYATLKKMGNYWKGVCPFHSERTASFAVSPHKEIFYCFGCHLGGDVVYFIEKVENCSAIEAVNFLSERYNIALPEYDAKAFSEELDRKKQYFKVCQVFRDWAHKNLLSNHIALDYLSSRSIDIACIKNFKIGLVSSGSVEIKKLLNFAQGFNLMAQDFIEAHILLNGKFGLYCPFDDRIIFPINDHLSRTCGFGGRIFLPNDSRAKYYNSHDHEYFNKGHILFGLDLAKKSMQTIESAFLVEGYTDQIAMHNAGFKNTVATLGTACTIDHLKLLSRYVNKIYVLYDGDVAGQNAIMRLVQMCWHVSIDLYVVVLAKEDDPSSYLQKGGDLNGLVQEAQDILTFFIKSSTNNFHNQSLNKRLELIGKLLEILKNIDDSLKRDILLQQISNACQIPLQTLQKELSKKFSNNNVKLIGPESSKVNSSQIKISLLEKKTFSAILNSELILSLQEVDLFVGLLSISWEPTSWGVFFKKFFSMKDKPINLTLFFDTLSDEEKGLFSYLLIEEKDSESEYLNSQLLDQFIRVRWKALVAIYKSKIELEQSLGNFDKIKNLLEDFDALRKKVLDRGIK